MNSKNLLMTLCCFLSLAASAGVARSDFYVVPVARGVGTPIESLPCTISTSGLYYFTRDLTYAAASGNAINVAVNNVTIDLMGFNLIGPGKGSTTGIYMAYRSNVEIRNGTISGFTDNGIRAAGSDTNHRIINVRVSGVGTESYVGSGIMLFGSSHLVKDCTVFGKFYTGIWVSSGSRVCGNMVYDNGQGIQTGAGCSVADNTVYNNQYTGIYTSSAGCTVSGNTTYSNNYGIWVSSGSTVIGNTAYANELRGIQLNPYCLVDQNTAYDNGQYNITSCPTCQFGKNVGL